MGTSASIRNRETTGRPARTTAAAHSPTGTIMSIASTRGTPTRRVSHQVPASTGRRPRSRGDRRNRAEGPSLRADRGRLAGMNRMSRAAASRRNRVADMSRAEGLSPRADRTSLAAASRTSRVAGMSRANPNSVRSNMSRRNRASRHRRVSVRESRRPTRSEDRRPLRLPGRRRLRGSRTWCGPRLRRPAALVAKSK